MNVPHKGQWRGALMFSLICVWTNGWVNNRYTGDLRHSYRISYLLYISRSLWHHCNVHTLPSSLQASLFIPIFAIGNHDSNGLAQFEVWTKLYIVCSALHFSNPISLVPWWLHFKRHFIPAIIVHITSGRHQNGQIWSLLLQYLAILSQGGSTNLPNRVYFNSTTSSYSSRRWSNSQTA